MQEFVSGHWLFWLVNYTLALAAWACIGRFMMQPFVAAESTNYIWRGFRLLTDWSVFCALHMVPSYIRPIFLPLIAAFWLFVIRFIASLALLAQGFAPRVTGS